MPPPFTKYSSSNNITVLKKYRYHIVGTVIAVIVLVIVIAVVASQPTPVSGITYTPMVPAYFYPSTMHQNDWNGVLTGNLSGVVINPSSGPGTTIDTNYQSVIAQCRNNHVPMYAYVSTDYGNRATQLVKSDIDTYYTLYGNFTGVFFDETTSKYAVKLSYYQDIVSYARSKGWRIIINPGTEPEQGWSSLSDIIVNMEVSYGDYMAYTPSAWIKNVDIETWHIVYGVGYPYISSAMARARDNGAKYVFITDRAPPFNIYGGLPSYWTIFLKILNNTL